MDENTENTNTENKNTHAKVRSVKDYWSGLSTKEKVAILGAGFALGYAIVYVRRMRVEVNNLNSAVAFMATQQGFIPFKK